MSAELHVADKLVEILREYGTAVAKDPNRCKGLLLDNCPMNKREINLLMQALEAGVPGRLNGGTESTAVLLPKLVRMLEDDFSLATAPASWAVATWATALGLEVKPPAAPRQSAAPPVANEVPKPSAPIPPTRMPPAKISAVHPSPVRHQMPAGVVTHVPVARPNFQPAQNIPLALASPVSKKSKSAGFFVFAVIVVFSLVAVGVAVKVTLERATRAELPNAYSPPPESAEVRQIIEPPKSKLDQCKAMIDKMAGDVEQMVAEVEAAGSDDAKVREITEKFKNSTEVMKNEGEELSKSLTDGEKEQLDAYGKEKMAPIMAKFMGVMMKTEGPSAAPGDSSYHIDITAGTVLDTRSQLTWQRSVDGKKYGKSDAKKYCADLQLGGGGWRIPTRRELMGIVEKGRSPAIDVNAFPSTPPEYFWSSTQNGDDAWSVDFGDGTSFKDDPSFGNLLRCVRKHARP